MAIQPQQTSTADLQSAEMLTRLIDQAGIVNRIHEALRSTLRMEDLCDTIVGVLVSRRGLGFSRAMLLRWEEKDRAFHACAALGALDARAHARLRSEMREGAAASLEAATDEATGEERIFADSIEDLKDIGFWTQTTQRVERDCPLLGRLASAAIGGEASEDQPAPEEAFLADLFRAPACLTISPGRLAGLPLPGVLKEILTADSLWAGIRTKKGTRFLLIVDKAFEDRAIDEVDRLHLNWFSSQAALAMENAEMFSDVAAANAGLRELDTLKGNFLSTISHELRTPLTAITGFTRLLVNNRVGILSPGQKQILDRVLAHAERLVGVVNDLIEIVEIDTGSAVNLHVVPVDPLNVLMETLPKLEPRKASKSVTIEPVVTSPVPAILADEKGLGRIFYHLIDNAVKFSNENGKVKIKFSVEERELAIQIVDQGIGIAPERLRMIFEAFYQVDAKLARVYEGMGIGLTLTKKLVDGTGGRILAQSEFGQGSTFTLIYPKA